MAFFIFSSILNLMSFAMQGEHELLIKDGATKYYIRSFGLWPEEAPRVTLPDGREAEPEFVFRFEMNGEFVMDYAGEMPVYQSDITKMYGFVILEDDGYRVYTGKVIERWSWADDRYLDYREEPVAEGVLQEYLQDGRMDGFVNYLRRISTGEGEENGTEWF